jgi:DNA-binding transcriptional ArsR family regulator
MAEKKTSKRKSQNTKLIPVLKALASPIRFRMLRMLATVKTKDRTIETKTFMKRFNLTNPSIGTHLSILREVDLIESWKEGVKYTHRIRKDQLLIGS